MKKPKRFFSRFPFEKNREQAAAEDRGRQVGVEVELFLVNPETGLPTPMAPEFLLTVEKHFPTFRNFFELELTATQVELITPPCESLFHLEQVLKLLFWVAEQVAVKLEVELEGWGAWKEKILPVVSSKPRYLEVAAKMVGGGNYEVLEACARVTGVHVHLECFSWDELLAAHNGTVAHLDQLLRAAANVPGGEKRLDLFESQIMPWVGADPNPPRYHCPHEVFNHAVENGWEEDFSDNWSWGRPTTYGTYEFRMFGGTKDLGQILRWVRLASRLSGLCLAA